ncbi:hypothetical protein Nepgr_021919 [Nepenthes gracilis]|uniref:Uncharacterized protein n=1 Tax=Nepenthes gracilis TaxID=150966 RepID=A0AAD3SZB1_NEPGR|nr:hypothetical protein Nepgr_021919 [Nepenthes gracilis]
MPLYDEVVSFLHDSPMTWNGRSFKPKLLSPQRMVVNRIMLTNLFLVSHFSSVPLDKAHFLYVLLSGQTINLSSHLYSHMLAHFASNKDDNLFCGCLDQCLLIGLGVQCRNFPCVSLVWPISYSIFEQSWSHTHQSSSASDDPLDDLLLEAPTNSARAMPSKPGPSCHSFSSSSSSFGFSVHPSWISQ